ncbi:MAG: hypothetical protein JWM68_1710 [Verrucomicrobiales bacterium]|nr:hypothetical protein [Verrucomicrobiales bacterium]
MKESLVFVRSVSLCLLLAAFSSAVGFATTFEVGPGKTFSAIGQVPWETLQPGDTVLIYFRTNAYAEKFVLCRQGTLAAPITIRGVPGANGELPMLSGDSATTRTNLSYWGENRGVVKIGGANKPADTVPQFITIENLDIASARAPYTFTGASGTVQSYHSSAASIWIEKGANITIRNCTMHDSSDGFFVSSTDTLASQNILVEGCYFFGNGNLNSIFGHNVYTEALGITFQFNRFGPQRTGCLGNNLKDRSAGLVVRYNWIEGGSRELDLVDAEDSSLLRNHPSYRSTHVYGNVLFEPTAAGNSQIVHYGGDSGTTENYRKGKLFFYNNTVISHRPGQTTLFHLSTNDEQCEARNNIFFTTNSGSSMALVDEMGVLTLSHNWLKSGYKNCFSPLLGTISSDGTNLGGSGDPGFLNETNADFHLVQNSVCLDAGGVLTNVPGTNAPLFQYRKHQASDPRLVSGVLDIGAFEYRSLMAIWRESQFGTNAANPLVSANDADPDGDGVVNCLEYAFGQNPLVRTTNGLPEAQTVMINGSEYLALSFSTLTPPCQLAYTVQTSSNLVSWLDGCSFSDTSNVVSSADTVDVSPVGSTNKTIRLRNPITSAQLKFMRVTVEPK